MNRFSLRSTVLALAALLVLGAPAAHAARPTISSVSPLKTKVGEKLTVRGSNFLRGANRNTVIFMSDRGPTVFVKASQATSTRMTVPLPAKLEQGMRRAADGGLRPNRFQLRVVTRERSAWTPLGKSPVIAPRSSAPPPPPDFDGDGLPDATDPDDDNDRLDDSIERSVGTQQRNRDTDGDSRQDGWEYYSAKDYNHEAVPYPGKRPYPNPLDPVLGEGERDWDGDSLTSNEEHALWVHTGRSRELDRDGNGQRDSVLGYSDGTQKSRPATPTQTPRFARPVGVYDPSWSYPSYPSALEDPHTPDGEYSDDERDGDNDGLNNYHETHGHMNQGLWNARLASRCEPAVKPWIEKDGAYYGKFERIEYVQPNFLDADTDGDGLLDAEDDQDHDDVPNFSELDHPCSGGSLGAEPAGGYAHPYNPCAPNDGGWWGGPTAIASPTCPRYKEIADG